jgi:DNA-binding transcriptional MerR regulator
MGAMTIGALAAAAGVGVETVRFYERRGLLAPPVRTPAGYRQYDPADVARLVWIRRAKELGFTLAEIADLLDTGADGAASSILDAATAKVAAVEAEIARLGATLGRLHRLIGVCSLGDSGACLALGSAEHR